MSESLLGTKIGHVRLVEKLATGGMGEVYAGFDETLQRKVALKCIRQEFHLNEEAKGRFLREARVLSQLGHPNICQIYDFVEGKDSDFIVMELVGGKSLGRLIKKGLDAKAKMRIAEEIAGVLVAAHEKGVVHRDLKPDNVMITEDGQVKVLDFGLSRQLGDEATVGIEEAPASLNLEREAGGPGDDGTLGIEPHSEPGQGSTDSSGRLTTAGAIMGTVGYMSPEQARGETATSASDMYSFGLLLQEIFTGQSPMEPGLDFAERVQKAKKGESLPVTGVDADLKALIERLKSLAPGARPSAEDALQRLVWIRQKPARLRKKLALGGAAAALVVFSIAMAVQSVRATRAEKRAKQEAETARQVSDFLTSIFKVSDPSEARGRTITAREILDAGAKKINTELSGQPLVQARMLDTMGTVYIGLGLYNEAQPLLSSALDLNEKNLASDDPSLAMSVTNMAILYYNEGKYKEAEPYAKRALDIREKRLGKEDPLVAKSLNVLAALYIQQGKYAEAEPLFKQALAILEKAFGPNHPEVAANLNNLALLYFWQGQYAKAKPLYTRALEINEQVLGPDHPSVANSLISVAAICGEEGEYVEGIPLLNRALAIQEKVLGPDHPQLVPSLLDLGQSYSNLGHFSEAEPFYKRALEIQDKALGAEHPNTAVCLYSLGILYSRLGRYLEAESLYKRALAIQEKALGPSHPDVVRTLNYIADCYLAQGKDGDAEPFCTRALNIGEKTLGEDHPDLALTLSNLATIRYDKGEFTEAGSLLTKCLAIRLKANGPQSQESAKAFSDLADCECRERIFDKALEHNARCLAILRASVAKAPEDINAYFLLASSLTLQGQIDEALGKHDEAKSSWKEAFSVVEPFSKQTSCIAYQAIFAQILLYLNKINEAKPIIGKILAVGYKNHDLIAICREKGLAVK